MESEIITQRAGRPLKAIRWTLENASTEFDIDRRTLTQKLRAADIQPGPDGYFSTRDICKCIYDFESPRDAKDRQHIELLRVQTEIAKKERIPLTLVCDVFDSTMQTFAATLKAARGQTLTAEKVNELMSILSNAKAPASW